MPRLSSAARAKLTEPAPNGHAPGRQDGTPSRLIPMDFIVPSKTNPRKDFQGPYLHELGESIKQHGVLQAVLVRPEPGPRNRDHGYELVCGECRYRAAKLAGLTAIPAVVRDLTDCQVLEIQLVENVRRRDLNPIEKAAGYQRLLDDHGYTVEDLAEKVGEKKATVYGLLKLLRLSKPTQKRVAAGEVPPATAQLVARIPNDRLRAQAEKELLGGEWSEDEGGVPSYREAKEEVERAYMVELKRAPFSQQDAALVASAGACTSCPKRAGNNPELYEGARADVCMDPACYRDKLDAHFQRVLDLARSEGAKVLEGEKATKGLWAYGGRDLAYGAPYVDLGAECWGDTGKNRRTYGQLLGDDLKAQVVVAVDPNGAVHRLAPKAAALKVLKDKHGIGAATSTGSRNGSDHFAAADRLRAEVGRRCRDLLVPSAEDAFAGVDGKAKVQLLRLLVAGHAREVWSQVQTAVIRRRGATGGHHGERAESLEKLTAGLGWPQLFGLWADLVFARHELDCGGHAAPDAARKRNEFLEAFGVDWKAVERQVLAERKAKEKGKKRKGKPSKNGTAKAPAGDDAADDLLDPDEETAHV